MSLDTLLEQRTALNKQIEEAKKAARKDAVKAIKELMVKHDLTAADITRASASTRNGAGSGIKVPPKWQDPVTGATWSGRGKTPKWFNEGPAIRL